jgi:hypothetical protein
MHEVELKLNGLVSAILASMVVIFGGCSGQSNAGEQLRRRAMPTIENRAEVLFQTMKTVCIGRYLIDVPSDSEVVYGPAWVLADIERYPGQKKSLDSAVQETLDEIEKNRYLADDELAGPNSLLGKVIKSDKNRIVFAMGGGSAYKIQAFVPLNEDLYVFSLTSWEKGKQIDDLSDLTKIVNRVVHRADGDIPETPGVCIDGALIADSNDSRPERVTVGLRLKQFKDVHFSIAMTTKDQIVESDGLEQRYKSAEREAKSRGATAWFVSNRMLRKGTHSFGKWNGYEILARKSPQKNEGESHEFAFTSHGEPDNPMLPVLELEMHSGVSGNLRGAVKPSITDTEAVYLWDKVFGSLRPRPVKNAKLR